ncbi:rab11 family-interacting protein 4B-like isoform X3 [Agrilus planipennis]|uniref:Rab11 family-interacting protein 4B-like isoform X3 n=1 Tax=Agrilus planipennis TaxID=224129 RepID=A0A7F5RFJ9_AGRPL|nr:rab11 family-interacting protein 4B-like isoform X3 [Agrilus planipennis]
MLLFGKMNENEVAKNGSSNGENDDSSLPYLPEMEYDMWEGQFEFVGPANDQTIEPQGLLKPPPFLPSHTNGAKKTAAHVWCEGITDQFQLLQQQVGVLQDSATHNDERYTRAKADNAALQARIVMLEEQLRDVEMRYEQRLQDEQKRSKELVARIDREKQLQLENASIRLQAAETEAKNLREEVNRQRVKLEKLEAERNDLFDQVQDLKMEIMSTKDNETSFKEQEKKHEQEQESRNHLIEELSREVERLRAEARTPALPTTSPETLRLEELHEEMASLRERNNQLQEQNEELQANLLSAGVEQGRLLTAGETSLAAELEAMTHDQIQQALKEQQDVNAQLKAYIDGILLNIVENYPQLLEVKQQKNKSTKT